MHFLSTRRHTLAGEPLYFKNKYTEESGGKNPKTQNPKTMTTRRRRLRLHCSSDEEEEEEQYEEQEEAPHHYQPRLSTTPHQNPNPNTPFDQHQPLDISDDDEFVDVSDSLSPPSNPSDSPIHEFLLKLGLKLRREWLDSCISGLTSSVPGFASFDVSTKAKLCFQQFLVSDMNFSGCGVLPPNVHDLHRVDLPGPFVLQVDEVVNISCALRNRYQNAPPGLKRCLKLSMTDGVQRIFGMEYRPIKNLEVFSHAGMKVAIRNVNIRRGLLMLVPEVLEVLGGSVEHLDAARVRLVNEINKPPRGKRTRERDVPSLASRATQAAWASNNVNHEHVDGSTHSTTSFQPTDQAATLGNFAVRTSERAAEESVNPNAGPNAESDPSTDVIAGVAQINMDNATMAMPGRYREGIPDAVALSSGSMNAECNPSTRATTGFGQISMNVDTMSMPRYNREGITEASAGSHDGPNAEPNLFPDAALDVRDVDMVHEVEHSMPMSRDSREAIGEFSAYPRNRPNAEPNRFPVVSPDVKDADMVYEVDNSMVMSRDNREGIVEVSACPHDRQNDDPNQSDVPSDVLDVDVGNEVEHSILLAGHKEVPFTYLASLLEKWALLAAKDGGIPYAQGKIKCLLTGVKSFQFKNRSKFELQVYVDDGSLISEVLIDHNVVKKIIGFSPEEIAAAISSTNKVVVSQMKEEMKAFQKFLTNFEGTMLIEINENPLPVALEMNEGCPTSDAWLLLRRLKSSSSSQTPLHHYHPVPFDISP